MSYETINAHVDERGVGYLTLARPKVKNAMNGTMYDEARSVLKRYSEDNNVRLVVLSGEGDVFCAGGDFKYQQSQNGKPREERIFEAKKLALWLRELDTLNKPLIGRINGDAYAGGIGLVCACDISIGTKTSSFAVTEARIGMVPGMISPYVVKRIGEANARRLFLNAKSFKGEEAVRFGMLSMAVDHEALDDAVEKEIDLSLRCSPKAVAVIKDLIRFVDRHGYDDNFGYTVDRVADMWDWDDATEGMASFFERRLPRWDWRSARETIRNRDGEPA